MCSKHFRNHLPIDLNDTSCFFLLEIDIPEVLRLNKDIGFMLNPGNPG